MSKEITPTIHHLTNRKLEITSGVLLGATMFFLIYALALGENEPEFARLGIAAFWGILGATVGDITASEIKSLVTSSHKQIDHDPEPIYFRSHS